MDNLIHADCLDAMAAMDAESIDAIVTDPPYGLEFMGKKWDRLGDVGQTSHAGWQDGQPEKYDYPMQRGTSKHASYSGSANRKCRACNSWEWDYPERKCSCEKPDFPNVKALESRRMQDWHEAWAREAFRIAKPGAHLLAFGGTRTVHRLAAAIEDAGWEIRDMLVWGYASGFPKSLDVSKAIDKAAGAEREIVGEYEVTRDWSRQRTESGDGAFNDRSNGTTASNATTVNLTAPATPDAEEWNGWGTALKPAWEPIVMARKPLRGTVAANVLRHGTGALNIDGTRIPGAEGSGNWAGKSADGVSKYGGDVYFASVTEQVPTEPNTLGRWPANVLLTDPIFDGGVEGVVGGGEARSSGEYPTSFSDGRGYNGVGAVQGQLYGDSGTYSRFFLIPKSARAEREPVLGVTVERANVHPTVKPLDLMRHLVRLVTPPGGCVLDPFLGSGTTALAAEMEGFAWIGIEKEADYIAITEARLNGTQMGLGLGG